MDISLLTTISNEDKADLFDAIIDFLSDYMKSRQEETTPKCSPVIPKTPKSAKSSVKYVYVASLPDEDITLFEALRTWRNQAAKDLDTQPFIILDNKTIRSIAYYKPKTEDELFKIKGLGSEKVGKYGETLIEIVKENEGKVSRPGPSKRMLPSNH